jgi:PAP2 superfamily
MSSTLPLPRLVFSLVTAAVLSACGGDDDNESSSHHVGEWNAFAAELVAANQPPPLQVNTLAIVQLAVHDAINAIEPRYAPYAYRAAAPGASVAAAVSAATRDSLVQLLPAAAATIDAHYDAELAALPEGPDKAAGVSVGRAAAGTMLALRGSENLFAAIGQPYVPGPAVPGRYQLTPPANTVIGAGLGAIKPFALAAGNQFPSAPARATDSAAYAADYLEVQSLGSIDSTQRTPEQTQTARFWYDVIAKEWHHAARQGLQAHHADAWQSARTLALLSVAMFDGTVASFDTKFQGNFWRPITAIRAGDTDGNAATPGDAQWQPLCDTPPFPEHNSTHAVTGAAAAGVLAQAFGNDFRFIVQSPAQPGVSRTYERFSDAAAEEGLSRIYCGIHFRHGMTTGLEQGARVAEHVLATVLRATP